MPIADIARLTDRQLAEIAGHKRDKDGEIVFPHEEEEASLPEAPPTLEAELFALANYAKIFRLKKENVAEARAKLLARYGVTEEEFKAQQRGKLQPTFPDEVNEVIIEKAE